MNRVGGVAHRPDGDLVTADLADLADLPGLPKESPRLSWSGTVDLALLHRRNPDEAFLTDAAATGPDAFAAAALLPPDHPHYGGHTGPSRHRDPMLLLECARQAETYAAHALYGVEPDAHFVLRSWAAEFSQPLPGDSVLPESSTELLLTARTGNARLLRNRLHGLDYDLRLTAGGESAGRVRMAVGYLGHRAYTVLRARAHPDGLPSSDRLVPAGGTPVAPARVGRLRATDVLLLDLTAGAGSIHARLRVPVENPSLFDHAQDHIPAMVLIEAARQLATLATAAWDGPAPEAGWMAAMTASFSAYAELAEPIALAATPAGPEIDISFVQGGNPIAEARVAIAAAGPQGGARWLGPPS
ncbi:MAG: gamma-butyrolactone biosynthesis protein [Actinobacteria bacterium]|nr:gamma-butyrolactone biosynthesis protein [Actinomycetota bacterium]